MDRLAYLAAMALLGIGLTMAQNTQPSSDPSNSSAQAQSATSPASDAARALPRHHRTAADSESVPNTTVQDQQSSTTSTTGASGQSATQPSRSTMGTTGSSAATPDSSDPVNKGATVPRNGSSVDQQPNSSTSPSAPPHAELVPGPAARAAATHTPDPGTCMNPVALQTAQNGVETNAASPCR